MSGSADTLAVAGAFSSASATPQPRKPKRRYTPPFSLRLTAEERKRLDEMAGNEPLGAYIRRRLFGEKVEKRRKVRKPTVDGAKIALVLAKLGETRLSNNINQLAKATNMGTLDVTPEIERDIETAATEIQTMKTLLIAALGVVPEGSAE